MDEGWEPAMLVPALPLFFTLYMVYYNVFDLCGDAYPRNFANGVPCPPPFLYQNQTMDLRAAGYRCFGTDRALEFASAVSGACNKVRPTAACAG